MDVKRIFSIMIGIIFVLVLFTPAHTQRMRKISRFNNVGIPVDLKHKDSVLKKGTYNLEVMKDVTPNIYYLRIYKRGKAICNVSGEELSYGTFDERDLLMNPDIPDDAKLKFRRDPENKIVNIIYESGKRAGMYPCVKVKFQMEYE